MLLTFILIIISIPSFLTLSFHAKTLLFCKSVSRSLPFLLQDLLHGFRGLFTDTSEHIRFFTF